MFRDHLSKIINGQNLEQTEMAAMISAIFSGEITDSQIGAFMAALVIGIVDSLGKAYFPDIAMFTIYIVFI